MERLSGYPTEQLPAGVSTGSESTVADKVVKVRSMSEVNCILMSCEIAAGRYVGIY